jgi:hypothetical protein
MDVEYLDISPRTAEIPILADPMRDISKYRSSEFSEHFIRKMSAWHATGVTNGASKDSISITERT